MGGGNSKDDIVARLDKLDREEDEINRELRELQLKLNQELPEDQRLEVMDLNQGFVPKKKHNPFKDVNNKGGNDDGGDNTGDEGKKDKKKRKKKKNKEEDEEL